MRRFRHYKGSIYEFLCEASHSETGERLVIYKDSKNEIYARPYDMFFETITYNGETVPRFKELTEEKHLT